MNFVYQLLIAAGSSLVLSLALVPVILKLSHRFSWYDDIDDRKIHTEDTPHTGGIAVFLASTLGVVLFYILNTAVFHLDLSPFTRFLPLLIAMLVIHVTGVIDDFTNMHARYKFVIQIAAAAVIAGLGYTIKSVTLPWFDLTIRLGPAAYVVTIIWLAGTSNAINFIDGMDGLSGGVSAIAALTYGVVFAVLGSYASAIIAFAIFGAVAGFLVFNWPPAKIFMGDCGAIYLGFILGALPLLEHSGDVSLFILCVPFSLLLFPVLDTLAAILRRIRRRVSIGRPDKEHTHHKLLDFGMKDRRALAILYSLTALPCGAIVIWAATGNNNFFWLVAASWAVMLTFFIVLDFKYHGAETARNDAPPASPTETASE